LGICTSADISTAYNATINTIPLAGGWIVGERNLVLNSFNSCASFAGVEGLSIGGNPLATNNIPVQTNSMQSSQGPWVSSQNVEVNKAMEQEQKANSVLPLFNFNPQ
jgi:hypothetical protein